MQTKIQAKTKPIGKNRQEIPAHRLHEISGGGLIVLGPDGNFIGRTVPLSQLPQYRPRFPWLFGR